MAGHLATDCPWVLVWTGACYWHGVGELMFNSSSLVWQRTPVRCGAEEAFLKYFAAVFFTAPKSGFSMAQGRGGGVDFFKAGVSN